MIYLLEKYIIYIFDKIYIILVIKILYAIVKYNIFIKI